MLHILKIGATSESRGGFFVSEILIPVVVLFPDMFIINSG